jgi:hypothetical protein
MQSHRNNSNYTVVLLVRFATKILGLMCQRAPSLILPSRPAREIKEQNSQLKTMGESCRRHSSNVHNGLPIWCVYRKQELDKNTSRLPTREAIPGLLHHALKAACENIPFEMFCPAENNITRHNIKEVCCIRFGFAIASLGMGW